MRRYVCSSLCSTGLNRWSYIWLEVKHWMFISVWSPFLCNVCLTYIFVFSGFFRFHRLLQRVVDAICSDILYYIQHFCTMSSSWGVLLFSSSLTMHLISIRLDAVNLRLFSEYPIIPVVLHTLTGVKIVASN